MSLIVGKELHELIDAGVITALHENVNAASIDIRIGDEILIEDETAGGVVDIDAKESPTFTKVKIGEEGILIGPGQCFLAHSMEFFNLPNTVSGQFVLRSTLGRCFLNHMLAGWADSGFNSAQLTLEFKNDLNAHDLLIKPGMRVGQMILHRHDDVGDLSYAVKGNYNGQIGATQAFDGEGHKE